MESSSETLAAALERLSSSDEAVRREAFSVLADRSRPFLYALLNKWLRHFADKDDVVQDVLQKVWKSIDRYEFRTMGMWWRLLRKIASNCAIDIARSSPDVGIEDIAFQDIPGADSDTIDAIVGYLEDRRKLYRLADEEFLDVPEDRPDAVQTRWVLAAKLLLVDRMPWQTVCRIVNSSAPDNQIIDRRDLNKIASDPSVLRHLAYSELFWENDDLCEYLLEKCEPSGADAENQAWTANQCVAIQLRYKHGLFSEQIANRLGSDIKKSDLLVTFDRCVVLFPFGEIMERLIRDVGTTKTARLEFGSQGLWYRLAFQYHSHSGLPQRDIYDRSAPAAQKAGFEMTMAMLNGWLSCGRILKKLADRHARRDNAKFQCR